MSFYGRLNFSLALSTRSEQVKQTFTEIKLYVFQKILNKRKIKKKQQQQQRKYLN